MKKRCAPVPPGFYESWGAFTSRGGRHMSKTLPKITKKSKKMKTSRVAPRGAAVPSLICLASPRKGQNLGLRKRFLSLGQPNPAPCDRIFHTWSGPLSPL